MIERYLVLDSEGNPIKRENYQKKMVEFYRKKVPCCIIPDTSLDFIFPWIGILKLGNGKSSGLTIFLESEDEIELGNLRRMATIEDKFRLKAIK